VVEPALMLSPREPAVRGRAGRTATRLVAPIAAAALLALLAALVISGHWPELRSMVTFAPKGLIAVTPAEVEGVEIRTAAGNLALHRRVGGWSIDAAADSVPAELAAHVEAGLRFLAVSEPVRDIAASELDPGSFAAFGLDPPAYVVTLTTARGPAAAVHFGLLNPAGTSQYVRLAGAATVHLLSRHVGAEWPLAADMAWRLNGGNEAAAGSRGSGLLLPVSLTHIWAVEIVAGGKLTRFERDAAGDWFRHTGQHSHANNANTHVADPAQAKVIAAALDAFDQAAIETHVTRGSDAATLKQFGLIYPPVIVLVYARDSSAAVARLELGAPADALDRYGRLAPDGEVVTVAEFEVRRLTELLKAVGAGS
jgi:hypothetical protein